MKNWINGIFMAIAALVASTNLSATDRFLRGINDLPLMPGLYEDLGASVVFDKPNGRIIVALARGTQSMEAIRNFYIQTLPQLGWKNIRGGIFERRGERLILTINEENNTTSVKFSVSPRE